MIKNLNNFCTSNNDPIFPLESVQTWQLIFIKCFFNRWVLSVFLLAVVVTTQNLKKIKKNCLQSLELIRKNHKDNVMIKF